MSVIKCIKCKSLKSEQNFTIFHGKVNKTCIECRDQNNKWYSQDKNNRRTKAKTYYLTNKGRIAEYRSITRLKKKYSLSDENYKEMLLLQKNLCAICETSFKIVKACVDHNHQTGKIRGLLCRKCNLKLQPVEDIIFKEKAESYLKSMK